MGDVTDSSADRKVPARRKGWLIVAWSLLGAIATAIGMIAVFFPDLFNLQKNKINEFNIQVTGMKDYKPLEDFLMGNRGKIVKLDVSACSTLREACPAIKFEGSTVSFLGDLLEIYESGATCAIDEDFVNRTGPVGAHLPAGIHFTFDEDWWKLNRQEECLDGSGYAVFRYSGFYLVPEDVDLLGIGWGENWKLTSVPEKDLLLKKY